MPATTLPNTIPLHLASIALACHISAALLALTVSAVHAQENDVIDTDRPGLVESANVVGKGRFQIEGGFQVERYSVDGGRQRLSTTPLLLRGGVSENLEFRLETAGRTELDANGETRGYSDLSIGVKWHLQDGQGMKPSLAGILAADLPTGSADFRGDGTRPSLRLIAAWELPQDFSLGIMPGISYENNENGRRFVNGVFGASLGKQFTERLKGFVEIAAPQIAESEDGGSLVTYGAGLMYLLDNKTQVDFAVSGPANNNAPDYAWTVGLARKF